MAYVFEWDSAKATKNLKKHLVTFEEATSVFADPFAKITEDGVYSSHLELREIIVGESIKGRLLVVAFMERETCIRLISARLATKRERKQYEEA